MLRKLIILSVCAICFILQAFGDRLYLRNTTSGYNSYCDIISAEITVRPLGAYIENELLLEFKPTEYLNRYVDYTYELNLDFQLPENSFIADAWYWRSDIAYQASLKSRLGESGEQIYNELFNFKLIKNDKLNYLLTIYPVRMDDTKKIKLTYLSPAQYNNDQLIIKIPANIITSGFNKPSETTLNILPSDNFNNPKSANKKVVFKNYVHPEHGECLTSKIRSADLTNITVTCDYATRNKIDIQTCSQLKDSYYQLSFIPNQLVDIPDKPENICFLIDHNNSNTAFDSEFLCQKTKEIIKEISSPNDSFNVIYSSIFPKRASDTWLKIDAENLDKNLTKSLFSNYYNTNELIANGINFINNNGGKGKLILITSNNEPYYLIDDIIIDIKKTNTNNIPIYSVDIANFKDYAIINSIEYINNGFLLSELAKTTDAHFYQFYSIKDNNYQNKDIFLDRTFREIFTSQYHDQLITFKNTKNKTIILKGDGFTSTNNNFINTPYIQLGKLENKFPDMLDISFRVNGNYFRSELTTVSSISSETMLYTIWNALELLYLENNYKQRDVIEKIISRGIEHRVLGLYTAFMNEEVPIGKCINCDNLEIMETTVVPKLKTYPVPFTSTLTIDVSEGFDILTELKIFSITGKCVKTFQLHQFQSVYEWDGTSDYGMPVKNGIYIVIATFDDNVLSSKIIKQ